MGKFFAIDCRSGGTFGPNVQKSGRSVYQNFVILSRKSYENMATLMRAIEEVCNVDLELDEQDPLSWLRKEKPSEETRIKVMKVIMKKQEDEIRKLKSSSARYAK